MYQHQGADLANGFMEAAIIAVIQTVDDPQLMMNLVI